MTKTEAHAFLNAVTHGMEANLQEITRALYATGDMGQTTVPDAPESRTAAHSYPYYATETGHPA